MPFLDLSGGALTAVVLFGVLAFFGVLVFVIIMLKKHTKLFHKDEKKPTESEVVKEELNRMLEDVKDEDTKKAMEDFEKNNPQNETDPNSENK